MSKKVYAFIFVILMFIIVHLFCGVFKDEEFSTVYFFIKYRPIWHWYFYSPRGISGFDFDKMTPNQQKEQLLFDEFILRHRVRYIY